MAIVYVDKSAAKKDLIREAVKTIERAIALHFDDELPGPIELADLDAPRLEKAHEHCSPEWYAIRSSLSSSIHSLNISLLLLQDFQSPADRLVLRMKLVDDAKAAGCEAYQSALSLCDHAPAHNSQARRT